MILGIDGHPHEIFSFAPAFSPLLGAFFVKNWGGPPLSASTIAHRHSLAMFTAEEGIAGNSAARTIFTEEIAVR